MCLASACVVAVLPALLPALPPTVLPVFALQESGPRLEIDPLLLAQVVEVYDVVSSDGRDGFENPVWPGWDARDTPILLYLPDVQDALLNHPRPPAGFVPVETNRLPDGWTLHLRNGQTTFSLDGQNTSTDVGGIETLVVADPISNLRPNLAQLLRGAGSGQQREADLTVGLLATDPYDQLAFVVHEAFHVHQFREAPNQAARETWLLGYPWLDAEGLAGFELEGRILERALRTSDPDEAYLAALEFLAVRLDRRSRLSADSIRYEDGTEFSEGLAKYTEWSLARALEGRRPGEPMRWARGFHGYDDLAFWRRELLETMRSNMDGEVAVNGDPYGAGGLRFRLYYSGMAIGALLDALQAEGWHERIFEPGVTLTGLVEEMLYPSKDDLAEALIDAREAHGWEKVLEGKRAFEAKGRADGLRRANGILESERLLVIDYGALADAAVAWSFTPFGVTRLEDGRTIYDVIPVSAQIGSTVALRQTAAAPALHDERERTISFALSGAVDAGELPRELTGATLELPGASITGARGELAVTERGIRITL